MFIFCVALFGLIFSLFLLIPLLMVFGPEGETGDVVAIFRKLRGHKPAQGDTASTTQGKGATRRSSPDTPVAVPAAQPMPVAQPVGLDQRRAEGAGIVQAEPVEPAIGA